MSEERSLKSPKTGNSTLTIRERSSLGGLWEKQERSAWETESIQGEQKKTRREGCLEAEGAVNCRKANRARVQGRLGLLVRNSNYNREVS